MTTTTEHLSPEEIERLSKYQLHGDALLTALAHVEECEECRLKIQSPSKAEITAQLFRDEKKDVSAGDRKSSEVREELKKSDGKDWLEWIKKLFYGKK